MTNNTDTAFFTIIQKNTKTFILKVSNYAQKNTLFGSIIIGPLGLTGILSLLTKLFGGMSLGILTLAGELKQKINLPSNLSLGIVNMVLSNVKISTNIIGSNSFKVDFTGALFQSIKATSNFSLGILNLTGVATAFLYLLLSEFDPQTLTSLDSRTLTSMDHS